MRSRVDEILAEIRGPRVLDVGCAGGLQSDTPLLDSPYWLHRHLLDSFPDTWGVDLSPERIDYLRSRGIPRLIVGDAEHLDIGDTFDTIVAGELIEHLGNPRSFLESAKHHLRPSGRIVLTTPYAAGLPNVLYAWVKFPKTCSNPEHTTWFCPTTLSRLASLAGLRIRAWRLIEDYPGGARRWSLHWFGTKVYPWIRRILPLRIRANGMLLVLDAGEMRE